MTDRTPALAARVQEFAQELTDTLTGVLGRPVGFVVKVGESTKRPQVSIMQSDDTGVPLTVDGHVLFRLLVRFRCRWDTTGDFLAVEESSFTVALDQVNEPIFHFDYVREPRGAVPVAHLNVHAHRDDIIWAMLMARAKRGKRRLLEATNGRLTRLSTLHFPLGGHRHRPALEDVLEMLVEEFGIDHASDAGSVIAEGRRRFRSIQTAVCVRDDPESAAGALRQLGYEVSPPDPVPAVRLDRLQAY